MNSILITGAGSGIGRATAVRFARAGWDVALVGRRRETLEETAKIAGRGHVLPGDMTKASEVERVFADAVAAMGRLDVLFNNAGRGSRPRTIDETPLEDWQAVLDINLSGAVMCARAAFAQMRRQTPQGGRIINIGSVSAKTPRADSLPYTTTKFGLQGMTHQLTMDGRKHNIVSSIIHPGATLSSFSTRRGRTKAGHGDKPGDDYIMAGEDVAKIAVLMAALPGEVNLYEATILPNNMKSFIGRG